MHSLSSSNLSIFWLKSCRHIFGSWAQYVLKYLNCEKKECLLVWKIEMITIRTIIVQYGNRGGPKGEIERFFKFWHRSQRKYFDIAHRGKLLGFFLCQEWGLRNAVSVSQASPPFPVDIHNTHSKFSTTAKLPNMSHDIWIDEKFDDISWSLDLMRDDWKYWIDLHITCTEACWTFRQIRVFLDETNLSHLTSRHSFTLKRKLFLFSFPLLRSSFLSKAEQLHNVRILRCKF